MKLPQLSLRDLFWLVLVAAIGLGWWVDRSSLRAGFEKLREAIDHWPTAPGETLEVTVDDYGQQTVSLSKKTAFGEERDTIIRPPRE